MRLFHERALPNLADNIKCGNSLIGPDYFTGKLIPDPDEIEDELKRVKPSTGSRLPRSHEAGGFDCIIGNPPYVRCQSGIFGTKPTNNYIRRKYQFSGGRMKTFAFFSRSACELCREGGTFA